MGLFLEIYNFILSYIQITASSHLLNGFAKKILLIQVQDIVLILSLWFLQFKMRFRLGPGIQTKGRRDYRMPIKDLFHDVVTVISPHKWALVRWS